LTREELHAYYKKRYPTSDIGIIIYFSQYNFYIVDIYFYGLTQTPSDEKLLYLSEFVKRKSNYQMFAIKTTNTVSFVSKRRTIQVVTGNWPTLEDIITNSDIDCRLFVCFFFV
jgi:hypothetical protein